jgi:hypothetical protein
MVWIEGISWAQGDGFNDSLNQKLTVILWTQTDIIPSNITNPQNRLQTIEEHLSLVGKRK